MATKEDLNNANLSIEPKPLVFSFGQGMFLKGVEDFLVGKEIGKYEIELPPEKAFGKRVRVVERRAYYWACESTSRKNQDASAADRSF